MTAKEFVKERMPKAKAEKQSKGSNIKYGETYWLIRDGRSTMCERKRDIPVHQSRQAAIRAIEVQSKLLGH